MSEWKKHNIGEKIVDILKEVKYKDENHHFGNPYLTAYQLAIEFKSRYPDVVNELPSHQNIGGKDSGERNSLSQYIARQISGHAKEMRELGIESAFLSDKHIDSLNFELENKEKVIESSVENVSIFRYNKN